MTSRRSGRRSNRGRVTPVLDETNAIWAEKVDRAARAADAEFERAEAAQEARATELLGPDPEGEARRLAPWLPAALRRRMGVGGAGVGFVAACHKVGADPGQVLCGAELKRRAQLTANEQREEAAAARARVEAALEPEEAEAEEQPAPAPPDVPLPHRWADGSFPDDDFGRFQRAVAEALDRGDLGGSEVVLVLETPAGRTELDAADMTA